MVDLSLESTESLIEELKRRSDALVLAQCRERDRRGTAFMATFSGNRATCLGLTQMLMDRLRDEVDDEAETDERGMEF